jgi:hypothetical protein
VTATKTRKLNAAQARALVLATVTVEKLKASLDAASERLVELRAKYRPLIPASEDPKDAGKDVREVTAGGFRIRVSTFEGGEYFSLKDYRAAGHPITEEMAEHIRAGDPRERWTWKDLRGPRRPDAVEPA